MAMVTRCLVLTVLYISSGTAHPVQNGPILKSSPSEVLFRIGDRTKPLVLECPIEGDSSNVQFSWNKDGQPLEVQPDLVQQKNEGAIVALEPTIDDEGLYQCFAKSDSGVASTRIISVKNTFITVPTVTLQKHKPVEGKPFKLDCAIPNSYPRPEIKWMYQFVTDPSISHTILNPRITQSPDGNLWFSNVTQEDTNENFKYVCLAKTPASDEEVVLAEHVIETVQHGDGQNSELTLQYVTGDMIAKVGDVTMIYCIYGGTPLAHPDWYKDEKNVNNEPKDRVTRHNRSAGKRLLIRETWLEDQGTYKCIVDNGVGQPLTHSMHLTVVSAPAFQKKPEPRLVTKAGQDVTIPCEVAGVPNAEVTWTYNAQPLQQNDRITVNRNENANITVADLTIKNVGVNDKGYYGCKAVNENGNIYAETLLLVS